MNTDFNAQFGFTVFVGHALVDHVLRRMQLLNGDAADLSFEEEPSTSYSRNSEGNICLYLWPDTSAQVHIKKG